MAKPRIAIIGSGNVGSAIRRGAQGAGYDTRATGSKAEDVHAAGAWGDMIVLAVPGGARQDAISNLGDLKGKVVVDPTNLLNADWSFAGSLDQSGAEQVQEWAPGARVVKAFNTVFAQHMATGKVKGEALSLLVAGDDANAKREVLDLGNAIGFEALDAGPLRNARYLEALGFLNIQLGYGATKYGADIGFKVVNAPRT